jgi:hypothetical protein
MSKSKTYLIKIRWSENSHDENFVRMTEREAKIIENGLAKALEQEEIEWFLVEEREVEVDSFKDALSYFQQTHLYKYFGPREWTPKVGRTR